MKKIINNKHKNVLFKVGTQGIAKMRSLAVVYDLLTCAVSRFFNALNSSIGHQHGSTSRARALSRVGAFLVSVVGRISSTSRARALSLFGLQQNQVRRIGLTSRARLLSRFGVFTKATTLIRLVSSTSRARLSSLLGVLVVIASIGMTVLAANPVQAATSDQLNFQGRLLTSTGGLVPDGTYNFEFNLYYQAVGGASQWTEDRLNINTEGVTIRNGYFSVYLGEYDDFPALDWSEDLFLGMTVRGTGSCAWGACTPADSEMTPRFKLTSVPYAFRSANVASSDTNAVSTNSDGVDISTGDALGATSNSGSITIDTGTATGTAGQILLGTNNTSGLTLGRAGVTTTLQGSVSLNGAGTALTVTNNSVFNGNVTIGDATSDTLTVEANATFNGSLTVSTGDTFINSGATLNTAVAISDVAAGGNIGTAATTVDVATTFNVNQTTASQALTLPTPTNTTAGRVVYVNNVGSSSFTMYGTTIGTSGSNAFIWNGTQWITTVSLSGSSVSVVGTLDSQTKSADGAVIVGNAIYLQTADATNPGLVSTGAQTFAGAKTFTGQATFQNTTDSTTAFRILNAAGDRGVNWDSTNNVLRIGELTNITNVQISGNSITGNAGLNINSSNGNTTLTSGNSRIRIENNLGLQVINTANLSSAFAVQNTGGTSILNVNTTTAGVTVGGTLTVDTTSTFTGLATFNGGLTVEAGDTFTFNGDAFTDFTGGGLVNTGGVLTVDTTSVTGFFRNDGNSFGATAVLGTNDAFGLTLEVGGVSALQIADGGAITVQNETDSTIGFQVLDADGGTPIFSVDTTNERVGIGTNTPNVSLDVVGPDGDAQGVPALGGDDIALFRNNGVAADNANVSIISGTTGFSQLGLGDFGNRFAGGLSYNNNGDILTIRTNNSTQLTIGSLGNTTFQNTTNSTTAFAVQNASGTSVLNVNTTTAGVTVGGTLTVDSTSTFTGLATFNAGLTVTGADINLNASSNFNTNINTGTSTGSVNIGNSASGAITITSGANINLNAVGVVSTTSSTLQFIGNDAKTIRTGLTGSGNSQPLTVTSGAITGTSNTSGNINILTGDASGGTNSSSGNISIDTGDSSGTGTTGTISLGSTNASALTLGRAGLTTTNAGTLTLGELGTTDNAAFVCRNSSNILAGCNFSPLSSSLTDNIADALDIQEGTNNYININTTDSSENISFGNATTNPSYSFLGTGSASFTGNGLFSANVGINNSSAPNRLSVNTLATADALAQVAISTGGTGNKGLVVQGVSGQTEEFIEVQNNSGTRIFSVDAAGYAFANNGFIAQNGSFRTFSGTGTTNNVTLNSGDSTSAGNTGAATVTSGNNTGTGNTGAITISSGNATSGNSGNITIDSGTASGTTGSISLGSTNASALTLGRAGLTTANAGALTVTELTTLNGGLTVLAGQNFTFNTDVFTDFTGGGLTNVGGLLTVDATSATGFFQQGGNSFGATATLGTNDANSLVLETNNQSAVTIASGGAITFQNATNSLFAFNINNAAGSSIVNVDTTNFNFVVNGTSILTSNLSVYGNTTLGDAATDTTTIRGQVTLSDSSATYPLTFGADVNLWRSQPNVLETEDQLAIVRANGLTALYVARTGDTDGRLRISEDGVLNFGSGSTATDASLFRAGVNLLATPGSFTVGTNLGVNGGNLVTDATTFNLINTTATTLNIGGVATSLNLGAGTGTTTVNNALTVTGLTTLNGGLTVEAGDTFTFNGDAFTDFTGGGLVNTGGVLTVDTTSATGFFQNGGNSFGTTAILGTNDAFGLTLEVGGVSALQIADGGAITVQNETDSVSGFRVLDADGGTPIFNIDTTNETVGIGGTGSGRLYVNGVVGNSGVLSTPSAVFDNAATSTSNIIRIDVAGIQRGMLRADSFGNLSVSGTGTGVLYLNRDSGTGGVYFGDGALGNVGYVSNVGNAQFNGTLQVDTLGTADTSSYLCRNSSNIISGCVTSPLSSSLTDNIADALDIQEGTNNYINIDTTDGTESISLGNATTNPDFNFLGSGNIVANSNNVAFQNTTNSNSAFQIQDAAGVNLFIADTANRQIVVGAQTGTANFDSMEIISSNTITEGTSFTGNGTAFSPDGQYMSVADEASPFVNIYKRYGDQYVKLADPGTLPTNSGNGTAFSPDGQYMSVAHESSPFITIYKIDRTTDTFTKLANPGTLPTNIGNGTAFSPDGQYMSVAHESSPFITIYKIDRTTDTFTKLTDPSSLPTGIGRGTAFSPDGQYMSVAHSASPHITIYKIDRTTDTFTKLTNPGTLPTNAGYGTAFSPDGQYMSVAHDTSPFITIYKIDRTTDTFTKLTNPIDLPADGARGTAFSPDGQYMSVVNQNAGPYLTIYKIDRTTDTFTKITDPVAMPTGMSYSTAFSPDGQHMAVGMAGRPYIFIYKIDLTTDTFTKLTNPDTLPGIGNGTAFSPDGQYMSVAHTVSPFITIYKRYGDQYVKLPNPGTLPTGIGRGTAFSPDGQYMSVAHDTSPFITIYKIDRTTDTFTKLTNPGTLPTGNGNGTAFSPDGQYMSVAHSASPFITIYKIDRTTDTFTKLTNPGTLPFSTGYGTAFSPDGQYMSVAYLNQNRINVYKLDRTTDTFTKLPNPGILPPISAGYGTAFSPDGQYMSVAHSGYPGITIYRATGGGATKLVVKDQAIIEGTLYVKNGISGGESGELLLIGDVRVLNGILTVNDLDISGSVVLAANQSLTVTGGNTASRPGSPTAGMLYYDTDTNSFLVYNGTKWVADQRDAIYVASTSTSSQADQDRADYLVDGTSDETEINTALTAATGAKVVLLEGTYVADGTILVPNNTTLEGVGNGTVIELADLDADERLIENTDGTTGTGIILRNMKLDGRDDLNTAGLQYGIYLTAMGDGTGSSARQGAIIENLVIEDFNTDGIYLDNTDNTTVRGTTVKGNTSSGIVPSNSSNLIITNNIIQGNGTSSGHGIIFLTSTNSTVSNNIIEENFASGITMNTSSNGNLITNNTVNNNGGTSVNDGIRIINSDFNSIINNTITDNSCTSNCNAIRLNAGSDKNYLEGNRFRGSASNAAIIDDLGIATIYSNQQTNSTTSTLSDVTDFTFRGSANSTTAFEVQNAAGTSVLNVDTTNSELEVTGGLIVSGLTTLNGGLTVEAGDTFTFNGDAFTDFTGGGLVNTGGVLTVDATSATGFFQNGGNSFGATATLGTNDANSLVLETNNQSVATFASGGATTFQNASDSVNAFRVNNNAGTSILNIDTVDDLLTVKGTVFDAATTQAFTGSGNITQSNIDGFGTILISSDTSGYTATLTDPTNTTAGRLVYVTNVGAFDMTLSANSGPSLQEVTLKPNTSATMVWNGVDWTAAGASSSTDLQAAYNNTATSAGGAELILNGAGGAADGLTVRNNATTPITGGLLEIQTSIGSNLFGVNNNAEEFATNGGAETQGASPTTFPASTWSAPPTGGTVTRFTTTGANVATGQASVQVVTAGTDDGAANDLSEALTPNLEYTVSFAVRGLTNFSTLETVYSRDGTNTSTTACGSGDTVTSGQWTRITCTFAAPSSGITAANAIFIRQTDATARTFYIDNFSVNVNAAATYAADGSVDSALGTNWTSFGAVDSIARDTSIIYDTSGSVTVNLPAANNRGIRNNLAIQPQTETQYLVSFFARSDVTITDQLAVGFLPAGGTTVPSGTAACTDYNTQTLPANVWTKVTCLFTTTSTTITDADVVIYFEGSDTNVDLYVDALTITLNTNNSNNVQVGGGNLGGPVTLFTLDRSAGNPIADNNEAYLGSMYYDTITGRIQCYEADGWGACGAAPDNVVNLNPEYAGAVLNGSGVGTMTADFCSNDAALSVNSAFCGTGEAKNFYNWTSPQATEQTYSIYVTYQLPETFNGFSSDDTVQLVGRVDSTANASVTYEMFRSTGSDVSQCGTGETDVITGGGGSADTWYSYGINGNEATGCGLNAAAAGDFVIFKINMKARSNANAYVSTLSFVTTGR